MRGECDEQHYLPYRLDRGRAGGARVLRASIVRSKTRPAYQLGIGMRGRGIRTAFAVASAADYRTGQRRVPAYGVVEAPLGSRLKHPLIVQTIAPTSQHTRRPSSVTFS
jgi:hypothetical protein